MKKGFYAFGAFLGTVFALLFTALGTYMLFAGDVSFLSLQGSMATLLCAGMITAGLLAVNIFNMLSDRKEIPVHRAKGLRRWTGSALLAACMVSFAVALYCVIDRSYNGVFIVKDVFLRCCFLSMLCGIAAGQYSRTYVYSLPRQARIRLLKKEFCRNKDRRFFLVAESLATDGKAVIVRGKVHGLVRTGDKINIRYGGMGESKSRILSMKVENKNAWFVKDREAELRVGVPVEKREEYFLYKYSVLTSLDTVSRIKPTLQAENPGLSGMIGCFVSFREDRKFLAQLNYEIIHGKYLMAGILKKENLEQRPGDVMDPLMGNADVQFPGIFMNGQPDKQLLAVFTDWDALSRWKSAMKEEKTVVMLADFSQIIAMVNKGFMGAVVNPFGPQSFVVSKELADSLRQVKGYQEEFLKEK